jgi:hypothetical protein
MAGSKDGGSTRRTQVLASGITIRQDFRDAARFVFFDTGHEEWVYATHGGTAFVVNYKGKCYALSATHVRKDFDWSQLVITDLREGTKRAPIRAVYYASSPRDEAVGADILDVQVVEFIDPITSAFFGGTAYILDRKTVTTSADGHRLLVFGVLKEKTTLHEGLAPVYGRLEFTDTGLSGSDKTLRQATAQFAKRDFDSIEGVSGAPVYDETANALCGIVVRGGEIGNNVWRVHFVDIFDIMQMLDAIHSGKPETYYRKTITVRTRVPKGST